MLTGQEKTELREYFDDVEAAARNLVWELFDMSTVRTLTGEEFEADSAGGAMDKLRSELRYLGWLVDRLTENTPPGDVESQTTITPAPAKAERASKVRL
jgi:hypothetical protein